MDVYRKYAYRHLLYQAMLDIRSLAWFRISPGRVLNPFCWSSELQRVRRAGVIADWLHNLAIFSELDFDRFNEEWFWSEHTRYCERHPTYGLTMYRWVFDDRLARLIAPNQEE